MDPTQAELLARIEAFALDDADAKFPFSDRLARENGWSRQFARRVVGEYKRFAFLAVAAGHSVTPSEAVDQAWHQHLCYTESYWTHFCRETLGRPLHHGPTKGGAAEHEKHCDWYERTLASYRRLFGEEPPEIWPPTAKRFDRAAAFVRVDAREHWIIPKPACWPWARISAAVLAVALFVSGCEAAAAGTLQGLNIFDYDGPSFLAFFICFAPVVLAIAGFTRMLLRQPGGEVKTADLPKDPYSVSVLAGGAAQAVNTAAVTLVHLKLAGVNSAGKVAATVNSEAIARTCALAPIEKALLDGLPKGAAEELQGIRQRLQPKTNDLVSSLRERGLILTEAQEKKARLYPIFLAMIVPLVGGIKIAVGLSRERPVSFLVILTVFSTVISLIVLGKRPMRSLRGDAALKCLQQQYWKLKSAGLSPGLPAEQFSFAMGLFGVSLLANTPHSSLASVLQPTGSGGCSSSGCSSGGGDGGGSGCSGGGSGCGGCGGGH